ncbi:hypothetical protein PVAND_017002 [Polypedilum vanderplanki]|uniref:Migration and invasion enhancer 1 n=1 Tax=Polypedilum vanderplanki TaxID=319348 RepID=A0A9J6BGU2_POLVA|nr:hypothetical protein PVAND_017002 [Polypedilum vanderplanki]
MSDKKDVQVTIEYCKVCDFTRQCKELKEFLNKTVPEAKVECVVGRRGSFEVKINENLVHSKLQTLALPVYEDVAENVKNCREGKEIKIVEQQKITDCCIM